ncbi:MAG: ribosome recycling factor [Eubacteriales bacterium]|nr:ribosome recycling factor [Eubacteriales bacterium]
MTANEIIKAMEDKMSKAVQHLKGDLATVRAGRANPHLLDNIRVDYYGTPTPIGQVANVSAPEPRVLLISPWDVSSIRSIEKAIQTSELGINPQNDGKVIRLLVPELTEERRKELSKSISKKGEDARVAVRNVRRDALDEIKKQEKDKLISEDERKKAENDIQKATDKFIKNVDDMVKDKEKEILSI